MFKHLVCVNSSMVIWGSFREPRNKLDSKEMSVKKPLLLGRREIPAALSS